MTLESLLCGIFSGHADIDEVLFDGSSSLCLVSGNKKVYQGFQAPDDWLGMLQTFALRQGLRWDPMHPSNGGSFALMLDGKEQLFRWHGLLPPIARDGILLSIRRHRLSSLQLQDFMSPQQSAELLSLLAKDAPVLIMGPTGAGKTSLLIALLEHLFHGERLAIIEQLTEIPRTSPYWIRLSARAADLSGEGAFPLEKIVDELLRLRPDRIVLGELRREELLAFKRALLVGHGAVWSTLHASSPMQLCERLVDMGEENLDFWQRILGELEAKVICLQRHTPRVLGVWQFDRGNCEKLISFA